MKRFLLATVAMSAAGSAAFAGGVERSNQSVGVLFEEGNYVEFGFSAGDPDVSGTLSPPAAPAELSSGDMTNSFSNVALSFKSDINERLSYAFIFNQPYGADVAYPLKAYPFAGSTAELESNAFTGLLKYRFPSNVSIYGGLRLQSLQADALVNLSARGGPPNYTGEVEKGYEVGYVVGAAYEIPEIAGRVSLTYNSAIDYELDTVETNLTAEPFESTTEITTPQSLHLEFQTGIAADTLAFGGVRWVEWTEFEIAPAIYSAPTAVGLPLVSYRDDRITYTVGLARRVTEKLALAGSVSYEENTGSRTGNLGPTDGFLSTSLAAIYTIDNIELTTGVSYVDIGDATTDVDAEFTDNTALGYGFRVGISF